MRVDRTLIAVGLFLFLMGLWLAASGYAYINVDRGPPELVSGFIASGVGLLMVALGFVLRELRAISADVGKVALFLAKGRSHGDALKDAVLDEAVAPAEELAEPPSAPQVLEEKLPPVAPFAPPSELNPQPVEWTPGAEAVAEAEAPSRRPVLPFAADIVEPEPAPEEKPAPLGWMRRRAQPEPSPEPAPEPSPEPAQPGPNLDEWLDKAIAGEASEAVRAEQSDAWRAAPHAEPQAEPHVEHVERHGAEFPAAEADEDLAREFGLSEADRPKTEVIGHYEANGAHYTMYADGSIEASSAHGVYRFANIEELKRFIEGGPEA